jgi:NADPH-dependent 2,4-dienoyl-CoA reductase/sulfur reductase-like enzyme/nitrite reductase/ring-hydroxylating ferredoxin subunit
MPEAAVCSVDALTNGEMRQVQVGETDVLLARVDGRYYAVHGHCTHYGAPLANGALSDGIVVCPWHHACFHLPTGDQVEPPGIDSLPRFDVREDDGDVIVHVPEDAASTRTPEMTRRNPDDDRTFVVLGAGSAGAYAVEALRAAGYEGRLIMVTNENHLPYDRPNCSKAFLAGEAEEEWMFLRSADFYDERDIERWTGRTVTAVDAAAQALSFDDGETMTYDALLLCTGGRPRTLDVPGSNLNGIHTLRSYADSKALRDAAQDAEHTVVVGASFIGMEVAQSVRTLGTPVTVVAPDSIPFERILGDRIGSALHALHEDNDVAFQLGQTVDRFEGHDGAVRQVILDDGTTLDADLVVTGIGVTPATDFVQGVDKAADGAIVVDEHLQAADGLFAAGDIAQFPDWRTGAPTRIEHWRLAGQHGRLAGRNMAGARQPFRSVPFFWTRHFGTSFQYIGHASSWDEILYDGDPAEQSFIAYFIEDGRAKAVAGAGRGQELAAIQHLMRQDRMPAADELRTGSVDLVGRLRP